MVVPMKIASFNVNGVKGRMPRLVEWLRETQPDVACLHPGERIYTFWVNADAFRRNAGFRMDFLLLDPRLATRLKATGVDAEYRGREKPSDHAPVWIELG